jgi:hypothetical protein
MSPEGFIWIGLGGTTKLTANLTTTSVGSFKLYWQRVENNIARNIVIIPLNILEVHMMFQFQS